MTACENPSKTYKLLQRHYISRWYLNWTTFHSLQISQGCTTKALRLVCWLVTISLKLVVWNFENVFLKIFPTMTSHLNIASPTADVIWPKNSICLYTGSTAYRLSLHPLQTTPPTEGVPRLEQKDCSPCLYFTLILLWYYCVPVLICRKTHKHKVS